MSCMGQFFFQIIQSGRGHGPDFAHIQYIINIRYTKTKSEVLDQNMIRFRKKGGVNFFLEEW